MTYMECPSVKGKKAQRWPCEGSREIVYFETDEAAMTDEQQTKLCDLVSQLNYCKKLTACIAGRAAEGENPEIAPLRAKVVVNFLEAQEIAVERYQVAPDCTAAEAVGSWVDIYLE